MTLKIINKTLVEKHLNKAQNIFLMKKRGTVTLRQTLIHLGMLALVAFVFYLLTSYVNSIRQNADFEMLFFSRDLALLSNSIYSSPGNVEYIYSMDNKPLSIFKIEFKQLSTLDDKSVVKVEYGGTSKSYPFAKSSPNNDIYIISAPKSIKFDKKGDNLAITKNE